MLEALTAGSGGPEGVGSGVAADLQPQRERCRGDRQEGQKSPSHDFARRSITFYERIDIVTTIGRIPPTFPHTSLSSPNRSTVNACVVS